MSGACRRGGVWAKGRKGDPETPDGLKDEGTQKGCKHAAG